VRNEQSGCGRDSENFEDELSQGELEAASAPGTVGGSWTATSASNATRNSCRSFIDPKAFAEIPAIELDWDDAATDNSPAKLEGCSFEA